MFSFFRNRLVGKSRGPVSKKGIFKRLELLGLEERITPANFVVTNLTDADADSLRSLIQTANETPGDDTITFQSGLTGTITLQSSLPTITDAGSSGTLTITGPGASTLTISGDNGDANRNFRIFDIATGGNLTISSVTVSGAKTTASGGAFNNLGTLAISNSTLSGNTATFGGGIANSGTATLSNSTLSGNTATFSGGGIANDGTATISNSTLYGNTASYGGGIANDGTATISNSSLSGNTASYGGGILNSGTATISNSTLSGNTASSNGGGIYNIGTATIYNTIIANSTSGGDFLNGGSGSATASNTLITSGTLSGATTATSAEINLGPLQNNGGATFTHALLTGSVAIGAGNATTSNAPPINGLDQRGFTRVTSDIGAFAFSATITVTTLTDSVDPVDNVTSLREAITLANSAPSNDTILFASSLFTSTPGTITLQSSLPTITDAASSGTLTISGPGASTLTISGDNGDANRDFRIFDIASGGNLTISSVTVSGAKTTTKGGAFNNLGTLAISNSTLTGNTATFGGGGIANSGTATLSNSTLPGNTATFSGGGILNSGSATITITNSTISGNTAFGGGGITNYGTATISNSSLSGNTASYGGGILNAGTATISNSSLSGNTATKNGGNGGYGGGIANFGSGSTLAISNSTLSGNTASSNGGGIFNSGSGTATISNSTLSGNSATDVGGGIFNQGSATIHNTIIANSSSGGDFLNKGGALLGTGSLGNLTGIGGEVVGTFNTGNLTLNQGSAFTVDIQGSEPLTNYNQIVATGTVDLTNATLNLTIPQSFTPTPGSEFILIANDGVDDVQGSFNGYVNNQLVTINGINYRFSYHGGTGNDVTLRRPAAQPFVVGTSSSSGGTVQLTLFGDSTPTTFIPFAGFMGEIRVSSEGDLNGDGVYDFVAAAGPTGGPRVTIMNGITGAVFSNFFAYSVDFSGGVYTGTGDVTGDGVPDLVTGAGEGGGPHVIVWDGTTLTDPNPTIAAEFYAFSQEFRGGVRVAAGDLNADGFAEILTGAGPGGAPQVNVYAGGTYALVNSFLAYGNQFSGGVYVAAGELSGDSFLEIISGAGAGGAPQVNIYDIQTQQLAASFLAYSSEFTGGVRVGAGDFTGDAMDDIITGAGPGGGPHVKVFDLDLDILDQFFAGAVDITSGVFVS